MQWLLFLAAKTRSRSYLGGERGNPVKGTRLAYFSWLSRCEIVVACDALLPYFCHGVRTFGFDAPGLHIRSRAKYCTGVRSASLNFIYLPTVPSHQQPSSNTRHTRRKDHKERLKGKSSLGTAFRSPCLFTAPCSTGKPSDWSLLRRSLWDKRIGRREIDCIYANTLLCVKTNISMHVTLQIIVSYHCPLGLRSITYILEDLQRW